MDNWVISFGPFRVTRSRRLLERDGEPVRIGSRAFDILTYLLERRGQVVSHRSLMTAAWPKTSVDEGNLRYQITALRKVLGDGETKYSCIANVPGRGYCFTAPISRGEETSLPPRVAGLAVTRPKPIPPRVPLSGREGTIAEVKSHFASDRIFSIVATDGMGETSVAVAHQLSSAFGDSICFVKLGQIDEPSRIADTLAVSLGLKVRSADPPNDVVNFLRTRNVLIVAD
jgi:DNA-binding winged helix-turn-helix (wHTH) protein